MDKPDGTTPKSYLIVEFQDTGSAVFSVNSNGVTPIQLLAAAEFLRIQADTMIREQMMAQRIQVPQMRDQKLVIPGH